MVSKRHEMLGMDVVETKERKCELKDAQYPPPTPTHTPTHMNKPLSLSHTHTNCSVPLSFFLSHSLSLIHGAKICSCLVPNLLRAVLTRDACAWTYRLPVSVSVSLLLVFSD